MNLTYQSDNKNPGERKRFIQKLFDSIAPTYDMLNRSLSLGIDMLWRKSLRKYIMEDKLLLDACCGTGDLTHVLSKKVSSIVSLDFSVEMLIKGKKQGWLKKNMIAGDASILPCKDNSFHYVTIAFGIRNIPDIDNFLRECSRVLRPGGALIILELTRPKNRIVRFFYNFYLEKVIPFIGGKISGKTEAYQYLSKTIATFIDPVDLKTKLESYNFTSVSVKRKTFGIASVIVAYNS